METLISHECRIYFSIGKSYVDVILCDVVEMGMSLNFGKAMAI